MLFQAVFSFWGLVIYSEEIILICSKLNYANFFLQIRLNFSDYQVNNWKVFLSLKAKSKLIIYKCVISVE